ncbi:MAG: hypothetical protein ABI238_02845 [Terrimesophilobacter sp.]
MRVVRCLSLATVAVALCVALAACAPDRGNTVPVPMPVPTVSTSASPSAEPDAEPTMLPGGTALANRAYFDFVNQRLLAVNKNPSDLAIVSNLEKAGFAKAALEVTPDKTSELRRPTDSIEFSVLIGDSCLIGQFEANGYHSIVGPVLSGGRCLIGKTQTIP